MRITPVQLCQARPGASARRGSQCAGISLVEVMVAVGVLGTMLLSLYAGFTFAFAEIRLTKENVRATQILEERMEVVRLLNWDQVVNYANFIPTNFTSAFYADNPTNPPADSLIYTGLVTVTTAPITESYSNDLRLIQIQLNWRSGATLRQRSMSTFVSQYGMQKYIY